MTGPTRESFGGGNKRGLKGLSSTEERLDLLRFVVDDDKETALPEDALVDDGILLVVDHTTVGPENAGAVRDEMEMVRTRGMRKRREEAEPDGEALRSGTQSDNE